MTVFGTLKCENVKAINTSVKKVSGGWPSYTSFLVFYGEFLYLRSSGLYIYSSVKFFVVALVVS